MRAMTTRKRIGFLVYDGITALDLIGPVSARQFSRQCRANFGCSPAALVRRLRLDEARRRLHSSAGGIERIAASVGFRSGDAFRRAFERQFGINPSAYRARFLTSSRVSG